MPKITIASGALRVQGGVLRITEPLSAYDELILASSPIVYYKMDEAAGTTMVDSSGNGDDGDYNGSFVLETTGVANDGGTSVAFGGDAGDFANMDPGSLDLANNTSEKTIEGWFNTFDTVGPLVVGRGPTGTPIIGIYMGNDGLQVGDGQILVLIRGNSGPLSTLASASTFNDGNDHHFALTMESDKTWTIYIDGAVKDTDTHGLGSGITTNDPQIAEDAISNGAAPHESFDGAIDNVAVYNTALPASTILAHFNAGL